MLKVCHLVDSMNMGGLENIIKHTAMGLDKKKYNQEVWCLKEKGVLAQELEAAGIPVKPFYFDGAMSFPRLFSLAKALRQERFHIIHAYGFFPFMWAAAAGTLAGVPIRIATCGSSYYDVDTKNKLKLKAAGLFMHSVVAVSSAVKKCLVEFIGISSSKISIIYSSANKVEQKNIEEKKEIRNRIGLKSSDLVIATLSRLVEPKGHKYLIEALALLRKEVSGLKYLVIGDGYLMQNLRSQVENLDLQDAVFFLGLRRDTEDLLNITDIFVQPSAFKEGLPTALAEAASAGLALIATDVDGNPEIVKDGVNGFIVKPRNPGELAEKILFLIKNPQTKNEMGKKSEKIWADNFTLNKMLNDLDGLYQHLAKRRLNEKCD